MGDPFTQHKLYRQLEFLSCTSYQNGENQWYGLNKRQLLYVSRGTTLLYLPKGEDKATAEGTGPRPMPAPQNMVKCPILAVPCNLWTHVRLPRAVRERGSPWRIECSEYHLLEKPQIESNPNSRKSIIDKDTIYVPRMKELQSHITWMMIRNTSTEGGK